MKKELQTTPTNAIDVQTIVVPQKLVDKFDELGFSNEQASNLLVSYGIPLTEVGVITQNYTRDAMGDLIVTDGTIVITDVSQTKEMALAKTQRLALKKVRTDAENRRVELKADSLKTGKAIDAVANYIKSEIEPTEQYLGLQEKFAENLEATRKMELKNQRLEQITSLCDNPYVYTLDTMQDAEFDKLVAELTAAKELRIAQEKAYADQLERERIAKEEEDARIREENETMRQQAEAREAEIAKEREEQRIIQEAELKVEREKAEAERTKREAIEKEQREAHAAEEEKRKKAEEDAKSELLAPDKQKLLNFADALDVVKTEKLPAVKSNEAQKVVNLIEEMLVKMQAIIKEKAGEL